MKSGCLLVLLLGFCSPEIVKADGPARYDIDLNRPPPKAGELTEHTVRVFTANESTNLTQIRRDITNSFHSFEVVARQKILAWDASNDLSKVEISLDRFVDVQDGRTNELAKPGTRLTGTAIAGETFFNTEDGKLTMQGNDQLRQVYVIRPRDFNEFARTPMPKQISVGTTWDIPMPASVAAMSGVMDASFINSTKFTGQLVGTTNLFGVDCYHLQFQANATELPTALRSVITHDMPIAIKSKINLTVDLFLPLNASQNALMKCYSVDFSMTGDLVADGKTALSTQGRTALKIISEWRPLAQQ